MFEIGKCYKKSSPYQGCWSKKGIEDFIVFVKEQKICMSNSVKNDMTILVLSTMPSKAFFDPTDHYKILWYGSEVELIIKPTNYKHWIAIE